MHNKFSFIIFFLFVVTASLSAVELSGTYDKDFTVKTEFNTIAKGRTLHVTNGATFVMTDAIVNGNIIIDKGCSFIASKDGQGYMVLSEGTHVEGIDLYYKVRVSDDLVFTRKLPMTLDQVWKSGNRQLIDWVGNIEFCYSSSLKGWISINEIRFQNPFNENLFAEYDMIFTQSVSKGIENECRSLIVKNKAKVTVLPKKDVAFTKINNSIIIEKDSSLIGTGPDGHKLQLKKGIRIEGLTLYIRFNNDYLVANSILSDLWQLQNFSHQDYFTVYFNQDLKAWTFEDVLYDDTVTPSLKKKLQKLK